MSAAEVGLPCGVRAVGHGGEGSLVMRVNLGVAWVLQRCRSWWRRWRVRHELYAEQPDRHPALKAVAVGELLPWKGTNWRVVSIRELPVPAVILVPQSETRASKIARLRTLRRSNRILAKDEATVAASLERRAR